MKQVFFIIGILLSISLMGQSWERIIKVTPVLDIVKDSVTLKTKSFHYQYPDRNNILSKNEIGYTLVTENIDYQYPKKSISFTKKEALKLIFKNKQSSLKCKERLVNMDEESKSIEEWQDNLPLSCFQIKRPTYSVVAILYSDPSNCSDNLTHLFLLDKKNNIADTLLVGKCLSEFDPHVGGFFNLKEQTILRRSVINFGQKDCRDLYEYFEINVQKLKFKRTYYKECKRDNIKTLEELRIEKEYIPN